MRAVSIHAPAGGATVLCCFGVSYKQFQSTPPQGGRLGDSLNVEGGPEVSIHAPAGGATSVDDDGILQEPVSIHAPAGGATFRCYTVQ